MVKANVTAITESPPPSVTALIRTHRKIDVLCRASLPARVVAELSGTQFDLGFEIARTQARNADEVSAKLDFLLSEMELGEVDGFVDAMRSGIKADLQQMEAAHV
jgi:hypothetical protein